ncbi:MAG: YeeE/YedE family protein [Hymenobacteraceae bacterium]|nr:YeeE/YedE family protein [Hymenobacteraceae bacterium]MDX5397428.1 YeeE/YedE family protein [Hymenobacteraceae bacterium]MDX5444082.1 YeeE/YedE family protein [Hymenobacteraceae bacterium]MDX5513506.1 YeeE/YedE family protein [Hymenobacteraceae bacterium]
MKSLKFILAGILFGIVMSKSEAISWYRIQEMFRFQSFHMYGIIGTAVVLGAISVYFIKKFKMKDMQGNPITFTDKEKSIPRYLIGGTIFGLGWALVGACPGPLFVNLGHGYWAFLVAVAGGLVGTFTYGALREKLPH